MFNVRTIASATIASAVLAAMLFAAPASAAQFNFRISLDPGSPPAGSPFIQTFSTSLSNGAGSYTLYPGPYVIETRHVFGTAGAWDNDLLVALKAETGTSAYAGLESFTADQFIYDNFIDPKSYSYGVSFSDTWEAIEELSPNLYRVGSLTVTIDGNSSTNDPLSPLTGFYLDTGSSLRTVLRNTPLRYSAVARVYTYDTSLGQVVDVISNNSYLGSAAMVPEPASWALLVGGFGLVGGAMRRRRAARLSGCAA